MGLACNIDLISDLGYPDATPTLGIEIDYSEALDVFCDTFLDYAQSAVPVDTGELLSSIDASNDGYSSLSCVATADYAEYVEYGTWKMDAQPYFEDALVAAMQECEWAAQEAIEFAQEEEERLIEEAREEAEDNNEEFGLDLTDWGFGFSGAGLGGLVLGAIFVGILGIIGDMIFGENYNSSSSYSSTRNDITSFVEIT